MVFKNLGLQEEILRAIEDLGFETPTPIQEQAITQILAGNADDIVGLAQTGTGKTAAFGLPLLQMINPADRATQGIVICPTRELCLQISNGLQDFSKYLPKINVVPVYGGASIEKQIKDIRRGAHIIVATPGRLIDLIKKNVVKLDTIKYAVLDEADEMFNMGFHDDIDEILSYAPEERKIWLFSATMSKEVEKIAKKYMNEPLEISVGHRNQSATNIDHNYFMVEGRNRYAALKRVIDFYPEIFGVIFCRTRRETQEVSESLAKDGYNAEALHGDLSQAQRDYVMRKFRERSVQLLVATDVAARGIDVNDVTHVINYNLPDDLESYTHRSGRTGRAGKSGVSIILVTPREVNRIKDLSRFIKKEINYTKVPSGHDICQNQLFSLVDRINNVEVKEDEVDKFLPSIYESLQELSKEELIQRFVSVEFNRFLDYYRGAEDINARERRGGSRDRNDRFGSRDGGRDRRGGREGSRDSRDGARSGERRGKRNFNGNSERFFMNLGEMDKINKGALVRIICDNTGINSASLGSIDLRREYSFFDVDKQVAGKVLTKLHGAQHQGRKIKVEIAQKRKRS
ncbi:DEAD/DEAH box helicase [Limibacter armeniacum]|uniref:DEAD/DEAH box helicase n=1 Tax=Limibacter armeniacum TaxID=466084 RepID=UPI002FE60F7E